LFEKKLQKEQLKYQQNLGGHGISLAYSMQVH